MDLELLKLACADKHEHRSYLQQPVKVRDMVCASNGSILLAVHCPDAQVAPNPELGTALEGYLLDCLSTPMQPFKTRLKMPVKITCSHCGGLGRFFEAETALNEGALTDSLPADFKSILFEQNTEVDELALYPEITHQQSRDYSIEMDVYYPDRLDGNVEKFSVGIAIPDNVWLSEKYWTDCDCQEGKVYPSIDHFYAGKINNVYIDQSLVAIALLNIGCEVFISDNSLNENDTDGIVMKNENGDTALIMPLFFRHKKPPPENTINLVEQLIGIKP